MDKFKTPSPVSKSDAKSRMRITYKAFAYCTYGDPNWDEFHEERERCHWDFPGQHSMFRPDGREVRSAAELHALQNPYHDVHVDVIDRAFYSLGPEKSAELVEWREQRAAWLKSKAEEKHNA